MMNPPPRPCRTAKSVLYVEDSEVNAAIMKTLFGCHPEWRLAVAFDGTQALGLAQQLQPSLLLLDIHLPDCRGDELLPRLRGVLGDAAVPAIAVTGVRGISVDNTGFDEVWRKPLDLRHVSSRLHHWLQQPHGTVVPLLAYRTAVAQRRAV